MAVDAVVVVFAADVLANQFQLCECVSLHCVFDSRQTAHRSVHKCNDRVIVLFFISHKKDVTLIKKYFKMIFWTYFASRLMICLFSGSSVCLHSAGKQECNQDCFFFHVGKALKPLFATVESNGLCKSLCYRESFPICILTYRETLSIGLWRWRWSPMRAAQWCTKLKKLNF